MPRVHLILMNSKLLKIKDKIAISQMRRFGNRLAVLSKITQVADNKPVFICQITVKIKKAIKRSPFYRMSQKSIMP